MALREINSDAHADARVTTGRAAGPNRVEDFRTVDGPRGNSGAHAVCFETWRSRSSRSLMQIRAVGAAASDAWTGPTADLRLFAANSQISASSAWTNSRQPWRGAPVPHRGRRCA